MPDRKCVVIKARELNGSRICRVLHVAARDDLYALNLKDLGDDELVYCFYRETRKSGLKRIIREMRRREAERKAAAS